MAAVVEAHEGEVAGMAEAHERELAGVADAHKTEVAGMVLAGEQERAVMEVCVSTNPDLDRDPSPRQNCESPADAISTTHMHPLARIACVQQVSSPSRKPNHESQAAAMKKKLEQEVHIRHSPSPSPHS